MTEEMSRSVLSKGQWARPMLLSTITESGVNTLVTALTPTGQLRRIMSVTVKYSASVSLDVISTLLAGVGAAWNVELNKKTLSTADTVVWYPSGDLFLSDTDVLEVLAPAGGAGVTGAVAIYSELF